MPRPRSATVGRPERAALVGLSLGGGIALDAVLARRERVWALVADTNRWDRAAGRTTDFVVGALHSPGGRAIIALPSWHAKADVSTVMSA